MYFKKSNQKEYYDLSDVGHVELKYSEKARNIRLRVHPKSGVALTLPSPAHKSLGIKFLYQKKDWIQTKLSKYENLHNKSSVFTENSTYQTHSHHLHIQKHTSNTLKVAIDKRFIKIWYPYQVDITHEKVQLCIRNAIEQAMRIEAKQYVPERLSYLAKKFGYTYNRVSIKNTKTRWGSCSSKKNINISLHIMRLPAALKDYLLLHELVHTKVPNHSATFWNELNKCIPGAKTIDRQLNEYHLDFW